jgi:hypothetical protein
MIDASIIHKVEDYPQAMVYEGMYNLDTVARYSKYKTQLKHNIIQGSCLKHVSYHIYCQSEHSIN